LPATYPELHIRMKSVGQKSDGNDAGREIDAVFM
jgi:hypothetical protein